MSGRRGRGFENRQARTLALQILFEGDLTDHTLEDISRRYTADMNIPQPVRRYLERLISGVAEHLTEIDERIGAAATAFPVAQLPAVDRNILRVAIYELRHETDVPMKAAINEAIELAKAFGGDNSSRFVNGVLGTIVRAMPAEPREAADDDAHRDESEDSE